MWHFVFLISVVVFSFAQRFAQAECIFNDTHCTCGIATVPGLCSRYSTGTQTAGTCYIDECSASSRTCDCSGTEVCTINACDAWKPDDPNQVLVLGDLVNCIFVPEGANCLTPPAPSASASPSASPSISSTSSATPSATPSLSSSATPSPSSSVSPSASPSISVSPTASTSSSPSTTPSISTSPSVTPSISISISPTASPSMSVSPTASPSMSVSPTASPSVSVSPTASPSMSVSPTASISSTPSVTPSTSSSPSPTPSSSPISFICPNGSPTLNLHDMYPTGFAVPLINYTVSATYGAGEQMDSRALTIENCLSTSVGAVDDYITVGIHPVIPTSPTFPGYCMLEGPTRYTMSFESHAAVVFQSTGFNFQPTALKIWDIDNLEVRDPNNALELIPGVHASETVAVFGARDGNIILPSSSLDPTTALETLTYTIPADSLVDMGLSFPAVVAPGAEQQDSNGVNDCDHLTDRITCAVDFSFSEPIDTLVIVYGFSEWHWAGDTDAKIFIQNPTVACP